MASKTVLISGAGIAGATAAYWLAEAGWQVTVVERSDAVRSSGNPVDVRGEAAAIVTSMGLWPRLRAAATKVERLEVVDASGRPRVAIDTRGSDTEESVEVPRAELAAALFASTAERTELIEGDSVASLRQHHHGVEVRLESGTEQHFDLVIGADGLHSNVRTLAFGPESRFSSPFGMYVGTMHTLIDAGDPHALRLFNRPGISLSIHPGTGSPLAAFIFRSREPYDRRDFHAHQRLIRTRYAGQGWVTDQAVDGWEAAEDVYFDTVTRIRMPTWTTGQTTLLGDAADCISLLGDGSSNAITGAKTLTQALSSTPTDIPTALAAYERTHRARIRTSQKHASRNSHWLVPATHLGITARDTAIRVATTLHRNR